MCRLGRPEKSWSETRSPAVEAVVLRPPLIWPKASQGGIWSSRYEMICQERISVCLSIYISLHEDRAVVVGRAKESNVLDPPPLVWTGAWHVLTKEWGVYKGAAKLLMVHKDVVPLGCFCREVDGNARFSRGRKALESWCFWSLCRWRSSFEKWIVSPAKSPISRLHPEPWLGHTQKSLTHSRITACCNWNV